MRATTTSGSCATSRRSPSIRLSRLGRRGGTASSKRGSLTDLVLGDPAFFGAKPKMVIKGGLINWALMGDPNASAAPPQPVCYRPMFGAFGPALAKTCVSFVSAAAYEDGIG